jgi:uncharacterized membrane protein (DUF2068 family)
VGDSDDAMSAAMQRRELGLRLIISYKLAKAAAELLLAVVLTAVLVAGAEDPARALAGTLRRHVTGAWSLRLTTLLARAATPRGVELTIVALLLDGALTLGEGWALSRGFAWAPWLVVVATGSLLPFELVELVRRPRPMRMLILLCNLIVVGYLVARASRSASRRP